MKRRIRHSFGLLNLLIPTVLIAMLCATQAGAQTPERPGGTKTLGSGPPACSASDKVEVTEFSLNPQQPTAGQSTTVKLILKSKCPSNTRPLSFDWDINSGSQRLAGGSAQLNPGASSTFTANWAAAVGTHNIYGGVATDLNESAGANKQNNTRQVTITIQPKLVEQLLNHVKAKENGANFTVNADGPTPCYVTSNGGASMSTYAGSDITEFIVNCYNLDFGGKGIFEAYSGFTLKNGWKIKSFAVEKKYGENPRKGWGWLSAAPVVGSTNPYFKVRLWAEKLEHMSIGVKIRIEGPEGTNPYQ